MSAPTYPTRAIANHANSQHSTGPRTEAGKAAVSVNAVRHGFTANLQRLDPRDSPAYQQHLADLTAGLAPANPAEDFLIRDLAMLKSRLDRLEAAEYTTLITAIDGNAGNAGNTDEASAYLAAAPNLVTLEKTERFLRRNYMQTWSRLERMQRQRKSEERERKNEEGQLAVSQSAKTQKQTQPTPTATKQESNQAAMSPSLLPAPTYAPASLSPKAVGC